MPANLRPAEILAEYLRGASMRTILKLTSTLYDNLVRRVREPHDFAAFSFPLDIVW
jgi:hypothetical protein